MISPSRLAAIFGGLVLGIHHVQIKGGGQLTGNLELDQPTSLPSAWGAAGVGMDVVHDLAQSLYARTYFFSHCKFLLTEFCCEVCSYALGIILSFVNAPIPAITRPATPTSMAN